MPPTRPAPPATAPGGTPRAPPLSVPRRWAASPPIPPLFATSRGGRSAPAPLSPTTRGTPSRGPPPWTARRPEFWRRPPTPRARPTATPPRNRKRKNRQGCGVGPPSPQPRDPAFAATHRGPAAIERWRQRKTSGNRQDRARQGARAAASAHGAVGFRPRTGRIGQPVRTPRSRPRPPAPSTTPTAPFASCRGATAPAPAPSHRPGRRQRSRARSRAPTPPIPTGPSPAPLPTRCTPKDRGPRRSAIGSARDRSRTEPIPPPTAPYSNAFESLRGAEAVRSRGARRGGRAGSGRQRRVRSPNGPPPPLSSIPVIGRGQRRHDPIHHPPATYPTARDRR